MGAGATYVNSNILGMPTGVTGIAHVACGRGHVLATTTTGGLKIWGRNGSGALGLGHGGDVLIAEVSIFDWREIFFCGGFLI
jgi:alpha-tubulin suppressor-like RCC1 family protein